MGALPKQDILLYRNLSMFLLQNVFLFYDSFVFATFKVKSKHGLYNCHLTNIAYSTLQKKEFFFFKMTVRKFLYLQNFWLLWFFFKVIKHILFNFRIDWKESGGSSYGLSPIQSSFHGSTDNPLPSSAGSSCFISNWSKWCFFIYIPILWEVFSVYGVFVHSFLLHYSFFCNTYCSHLIFWQD